jgi:hypothetical protein
MSLASKHKNFKDEYKLRSKSKYQAPHVYISDFQMTIFQELLNW